MSELIDNVGIMPSTAAKSIHAVSNNGSANAVSLQESSHSSWRRFIPQFVRELAPSHWEHIVVNNKIDSVTLPKWAAASILGAVLTFGMASWWRASNEHDTLIEIRTELKLAKETNAEKDRILNGKLNDLDAWKTVVSKDQREIIGMLKQAQIDALARPGIRQPQSSQ